MNSEALKDRLKYIAKEQGRTFNEVWKQLLLERFLARLSSSSHQKSFIFKGGLLLAQYLEIGRETKDVDFLLKRIRAERPAVEAALKEVISADLEDGFQFTWSGIEELQQPHMEYAGFRATLNVGFEKMKDKIQIDIGVGDTVEQIEEDFELFVYKGKPIFSGAITLQVYPVEAILAEKLEAIISKGALNSRMKDYHDVILMTREAGLLDVEKAKSAIESTFGNRGTKFVYPIVFSDQGLANLQTLWTSHLRGLSEFWKTLRLPDEIGAVLEELNSWISAHFKKD